MTRSRTRHLEQGVIDAARAMASGAGDVCGVVDAVRALDAHISPITDAVGAFAPARQTSEEAALASVPMVGTARRSIIDEIRALRWSGGHGLTDDEIERRLHRKHTTVSSARNWLCEQGWLRDSGHRRRTSSGRDAIVWCLTDAALTMTSSDEWIRRSR